MQKSTQVLQKEAEQLETAIAEEIETIQEKLWFKIKIGFSIALVGIGTFWIVKKWLDYPLRWQDFFPQSPNNEAQKQISQETSENYSLRSNQELDIVAMIKREIAMFLLAIAKQKIYELLEKLTNYENEVINEYE
ncbi:MAG: hypothetical protein NZ516_08550 [Raineya sp.]|nr:hypothetical protein [Raineya sp.]